MEQLALTLWFAVATLFGPSLLCCCTAATPQPVAASKPVKSCCQHDVAPTAPKPVPAPKEKPKCPCQAKASTDALPTAVETPDEYAAQIRDANPAFFELSPIPFDGMRSLEVAAVRSVPESLTLSGRALLAAYSILRC